MTNYQAMLDRCCGPAPKPFVRRKPTPEPKPLSGIEKHERELDSIDHEFQRFFAERNQSGV